MTYKLSALILISAADPYCDILACAVYPYINFITIYCQYIPQRKTLAENSKIITISLPAHSVSIFKSLQIDVELHRAVVASHNIRQDPCVSDLVCYPVAHQEVVDTPSGIVLASTESV